jgi:uncharacterized protein YpbB
MIDGAPNSDQQRDAQCDLDDPIFRQELVRELKDLFHSDFEEESTQQLQDILNHVRSNQTITMGAADEYTQARPLFTIVTKTDISFFRSLMHKIMKDHHSKGMPQNGFTFI